MHQRLPLIVLVAWVALVGVGQWWAASGALEPPTMDVYSYAVKAKSVWAAVTQGPWVNPFDIAPTIRPPGTILMSYPFGFGADFHGYYFRSVFLPVALIALAVWLVTFYTSRYVSLASIVAAAAIPLAAFLLNAPTLVIGLAVAIGLFVIVLHRANIKRLLAGTENRFVKKSAADVS